MVHLNLLIIHIEAVCHIVLCRYLTPHKIELYIKIIRHGLVFPYVLLDIMPLSIRQMIKLENALKCAK